MGSVLDGCPAGLKLEEKDMKSSAMGRMNGEIETVPLYDLLDLLDGGYFGE